MATFELQGGDGKTYEVEAPDMQSALSAFGQMANAPQLEVSGSADTTNGLRRRVRTPEEVARSKRDFFESPEQAQRWAETNKRVAMERATDTGSPILGTTGRDVLRNLSEGFPIGSYLDEANAGLADVANRVTGGKVGEPYQDRMDYHAAYDAQKDADSTVLAEDVPVIGDITAGGLTKLAGGVMSAPFAPMIKPLGGATALPQIANGALTGAAYGAGYGAGQGQGMDRLGNAGYGAAIGSTVGGAAPVVANGVGYVARAVGNRLRALPPELARGGPGGTPIDRRAATLVSEDMQAGGLMDPNSPNFFDKQAAALGPEAGIMDMSRRTQAAAGGVAASEQGQMVADTITQRRRLPGYGAADRINRDLDANMGAPVNTVAFESGLRSHYGPLTKPHYDDFYSRNIPITNQMRTLLKRANASGAVKAARKLMETEGIDPRNLSKLVDDELTPMTGRQVVKSERVPHGQEFDYIKRGIDQLAREAAPGSKLQTALQDLARELRNSVDDAISPGKPKDSPWAKGRAISGEEFGVKEALALGKQVFGKNMTPDQLAAELAPLSAMEREAVIMAARQDLRARMGSAAAAYGAKPDVAGRQALNSIDAREKLGMVIGKPEARNITRRIDAENTFADTDNRVLGNSATAERTEVLKRYRPPVDSHGASNLRQATIPGLIIESVARVGNALLRGAIDERRMRTLLDSGRLLSAQREVRDKYAKGLMEFARRRNATTTQMRRIEEAARLITEGSRSKAVEQVTE
jgi:hypothetical protein